MTAKPLVIAIAGPTATGKTDAAVAVCKALDGEVISMDSMQIYKGFDLGTAKPDAAEMNGIAHHMLSFVPPSERYSVAQYQQDARSIMKDILSKNRLPVFAGGTGLYLQAVGHPLSFTQAVGTDALRSELEAEAAGPDGVMRLHRRLEAIDPKAAARLHPNNTRRVIRALEVCLQTGRPISDQQGDWEAESEEDWLVFALTWPREVLYARINHRVDLMVEAGLIEEVASLLEQGVPRNAQAMQAIGYKEIVQLLDGNTSRADAIETLKRNTRRYAKRQLTWLRRDSRVRWIDVSSFSSAQALHQDLIHQIAVYKEKRDVEG